jgi:hypothetical protein
MLTVIQQNRISMKGCEIILKLNTDKIWDSVLACSCFFHASMGYFSQFRKQPYKLCSIIEREKLN